MALLAPFLVLRSTEARFFSALGSADFRMVKVGHPTERLRAVRRRFGGGTSLALVSGSMGRPGILFALAVALLGGCSTTYRQARPATVEQLRTLIDEDAAPREARRTARDQVTLLHQPGREPPSIPVVPPAPTGARSEDGDLSLVDLSELRGIEVKRRVRGAFDGLVWGFLAGAVAGSIAGATQGDDPPGQLIRFTGPEKAVGGGLLLGGAGAVVGAVVGALVGHTDRYLF